MQGNGMPFDKAQDRPFDKAHGRPFDEAQDRPFDKAQDREEERGWVREAVDGDQEAFARLVESHQAAVYNLAYRMLGNAGDAEDAAQETFLRAYSRLRSYDPARKFSSWLRHRRPPLHRPAPSPTLDDIFGGYPPWTQVLNWSRPRKRDRTGGGTGRGPATP